MPVYFMVVRDWNPKAGLRKSSVGLKRRNRVDLEPFAVVTGLDASGGETGLGLCACAFAAFPIGSENVESASAPVAESMRNTRLFLSIYVSLSDLPDRRFERLSILLSIIIIL